MADYAPPSNLFAPPPHHAHSASTPPAYPAHVNVNVNPAPPPVQHKEPFAIKVMRLPSPSFVPLSPLAWKLDSCAGDGAASGPLLLPSVPGCELSLSPQLLLPTNIGTVYLGESFRACVGVWAQAPPPPPQQQQQAQSGSAVAAPAAFHQVGIKLELQTSSRRWTLADSTPAAQNFSMAVGGSKELIVAHNLSELGVNCLVCLVSYKDEYTGEKRSFQKFFKFHVHDPFSIHTTVHQREGVLLAEVALTSLLNRAVYLWNVHFESANPALIAVEDLNATTTDEAAAVAAAGAPALAEGAAAADPTAQSHDGARARTSSAAAAEKPGQGVLLPGQSSRSFLFRLIELKPASKHVLDLGRLQIRWRSLIGENGRIKSSNVSRTSKPLSRELDLAVVEAPARVAVERPFVVAATARNGSNAPALLVVQLLKDRMGTLLPCGPAIRQLGVVGAHSTCPFSFTLVGVGLGVQRISGLRLSLTPLLPGSGPPMPNTAATVVQDFDHLHQLVVESA